MDFHDVIPTYDYYNRFFYSKKQILNGKADTLRLKSHWPLGSVWRKTILNIGSVGGAGVDPKT